MSAAADWKRPGEAATEAERALEGVLAQVERWQGAALRYRPVSGGISNTNWRIGVEGASSDYFLKVPGRGTEMFIERVAANDASRRVRTSTGRSWWVPSSACVRR